MRYELFPELTPKTLNAVLRNNIRIDAVDDLSLETAKALQELGLIRVIERNYTRCVNTSDPDYHQLSPEQRRCDGEIDLHQDVCPICGRQIEAQSSKEAFSVSYILLEYVRIAEYIEKTLSQITEVASVNKISANSLNLHLKNGRMLKVVLLNSTTDMNERYEGIYFAGTHLYIYYAIYDKPPTNLLNNKAIMWLGDFLSQSEHTLSDQILKASAPTQSVNQKTFEACEQLFDQYIQKVIWQDFEKLFAPGLINHIIQKPNIAQAYLNDLQALDHTIFGSFPVSIGGAGETDLRLITKYEIMSTVFAAKNILDAKRYSVTSSITSEHVIGIVNHLNQIPRNDQGSAIILASTDQIQSAAWANVCRYRDTHHYWQIVILPKYLVIELIAIFDAYDLIQ